MASRSLQDLHPDTANIALRALAACEQDPHLQALGLSVLVTCTYRSNAEQAQLYGQGRTRAQLDAVGLTAVQPTKGPIVTRALPGKSDHNRVNAAGKPASRAMDIVPLRHGKPLWSTAGDGIDDNPADDETDDLEAWQRIAVHFKAAGFQWYGEPDAPFREMPHFHDPRGEA